MREKMAKDNASKCTKTIQVLVYLTVRRHFTVCFTLLVMVIVLFLSYVPSLLVTTRRHLAMHSGIFTPYAVDTLCDRFPCNNFTRYITVPKDNSCKKMEDIFLLVLVKSEVGHSSERKEIRQTWGEPIRYHGLNIRTFFVLQDNASISGYYGHLNKEAFLFSDLILVSNDPEEPHSALIVPSLKWIGHTCKADYVLVTDDSSFVMTWNILDTLLLQIGNMDIPYENSHLDQHDERSASRMTESDPDQVQDNIIRSRRQNISYDSQKAGFKLHVIAKDCSCQNTLDTRYDYKSYKNRSLSPSCPRDYLMSKDMVEKVVRIADFVRFHPDDRIFITELGRQALHVECTHFPGLVTFHSALLRDQVYLCDMLEYGTIISAVPPSDRAGLWALARDTKQWTTCMDQHLADSVRNTVLTVTLFLCALCVLCCPRYQAKYLGMSHNL